MFRSGPPVSHQAEEVLAMAEVTPPAVAAARLGLGVKNFLLSKSRAQVERSFDRVLCCTNRAQKYERPTYQK